MNLSASHQEPRFCLDVGQRLEDYRIVRRVSDGGMKVVFEALQERQHRRAAIKLLHPDCLPTPESTTSLVNEARALRRVRHPGIVEIFDAGQFPDQSHYIIMEYLDGETLREKLDQVDGGLAETQALDLGWQIAAALEAVHAQNMVHRDLNPGNIFLLRDPACACGLRIKIANFGTARMDVSAEPTAGRTMEFTASAVEYSSPEQCQSAEDIDARADIYSLGTILYQMLGGQPPFTGSWMEVMTMHIHDEPAPLVQLRPQISPEVAILVHQMLAKPRSERPSASEVAGALLLLKPAGALIAAMAGGQTETSVYQQPSTSMVPSGGRGLLGSTIAHYELVRMVGQGGFGAVFEALDLRTKQRAAIKLLLHEFVANKQIVARFVNEARALSRVRHPCIVEYLDSSQLDDGTVYIAMEYLEGRSLRDCLDGGALPESTALQLAHQIALAMGELHTQKIIHRDLKPDNLMLIPDPQAPGGLRLKILDFGIAKLPGEPQDQAADSFQTGIGTIMGTPAYMAPEQCRDASSVTDKADVYSLGILLYQMLAGRPPFVAEGVGALMLAQIKDAPPPLRELAPLVTAPLVVLVNRMLAKTPGERPTMQEVARELDARLAAQENPGPLPLPALRQRNISQRARVRLRALGGRYDGFVFDVPARRAFTMGSSRDNELSLWDSSLASRHASISMAEGRLKVTALDPQAAIYVNDSQVRGFGTLRPGDILRCGDLSFYITVAQRPLRDAFRTVAEGPGICLRGLLWLLLALVRVMLEVPRAVLSLIAQVLVDVAKLLEQPAQALSGLADYIVPDRRRPLAPPPMSKQAPVALMPGQGNKTIDLDATGDVAMAWIMGLNGKYKDKTFKLRPRTVVGTASNCDIVIDDALMSSHHCEIRQGPEGFKLVDLGSTNGIVVNDMMIREHFLVDNDAFRLGGSEFKFKAII